MLNSIPTRGAVRTPRAIVRLGGQAVTGWESWTVDNNSFYEADTFTVKFAASKLPAAFNAKWFSQQTEVFCEVLAGFPANPSEPSASELTSLIYGRVDDIRYGLATTDITLTGRDLTAVFIDKKLDAQYQNTTSSGIAALLSGAHGFGPEASASTSSDVAVAIASSHGLDAVVKATTAPIGTYYDQDQVTLTAGRSEWDLLCWLAREEGYAVYVAGRTLYFVPNPTGIADPYVIRWSAPDASRGSPSANLMELNCSRSCTVARGIVVTVRSPKGFLQKGANVASYPVAARPIKAGRASPFGGVQTYYFNLPPGKTPAQIESYAERKYHEIIAHAMCISARLPADGLLSIATTIRVEGTGTEWDQLYYPRQIRRSMSLDEGYLMEVDAQNSTPDLAEAASPL